MRKPYPRFPSYQPESRPVRKPGRRRGVIRLQRCSQTLMNDPTMSHERPCCGVSTNIEDYFLTRRKFLNRVGMGIGALGLATMLDPSQLFADDDATSGFAAGANPLAPRKPPLAATAKAVIHIFAQGAPSHIDTWDPKPELVRMDGQTIGDSGVAMGSPF